MTPKKVMALESQWGPIHNDLIQVVLSCYALLSGRAWRRKAWSTGNGT